MLLYYPNSNTPKITTLESVFVLPLSSLGAGKDPLVFFTE
jgi:hypothetical protein